MKDYYAQRAQNYEEIYDAPEREDDLEELQEKLIEVLEGRKVLEIACGTGYWTEQYALFAESVVATDINQSMLELAQHKDFDDASISFVESDAFDLPAGDYDAAFAGFWWSHIKKEQQADFLKHVRSKLPKDSLLVLIDDNDVEGVTLPIARTDMEGNTFQLRTAADGSRVEILKNFPTDSYLRKKFANFARDIRIYRNEYYWMLTCVLR